MKKRVLLMAFVLLLFTACSSEQISEESKPDLEELTDHVYVDYDRTRYENVSAPPVYYAQHIRPDDSALASFFSSPPQIYDSEGNRVFENENKYGRYGSHGIVSYREKNVTDAVNIHSVSEYCLDYDMSSVKELDFMSPEELYKRFDEDVRKFIDKYEIYEMTAFTAETFEEITTLTRPSDLEEGWYEPRDVYYIRARQFVNEIPIFTGAYTPNPNVVPVMYHAGAEIEACYTKNGLEYFSIYGGYKIGEEKPADGEFIGLKGAEQIIRDYYDRPYPYHDVILYDCALVYVGVFEGDKTVLTPAWEFYSNEGQGSWYDIGGPVIRINAYTGDLMWEN